MPEGRLVYSTDGRDLRPPGGRKRAPAGSTPGIPDDGIVRIFRERGGRRGRTVTVIRGLPTDSLETIASELKRRCGSGGAVKAGAVEIQGDHREQAAEALEMKGYRVKLAGG